MSASREVKLFRNGRNQAVRIPRNFELPGSVAIMRREGNTLVIEPAPPDGPNARLLAVLDTLEGYSGEDALLEIEDRLPDPFDL